MKNPGVITATKPENGQRVGQLLSSIFSKYGIFLVFAVMVLVASLLSPAFMSRINLINIVRQMSVVGLIALGVTGVIVSAGIDLSSGSVVGLTAVVAASLAQDPDFNPLLSRPSRSLNYPGVSRLCRRCVGGFDQRHPGCKNSHSTVYRYFGHLYCNSRCWVALHRRSSDFRSDGRI